MEIGQEIISTAILSLPLIQVAQLSVTRYWWKYVQLLNTGENMCTKYWLTALRSKPVQYTVSTWP